MSSIESFVVRCIFECRLHIGVITVKLTLLCGQDNVPISIALTHNYPIAKFARLFGGYARPTPERVIVVNTSYSYNVMLR